MAVTTDVDIANLALARLGQDAITTLTAGTRDATVINRVFDQNRDYCLGMYSWVSVTQMGHLVRAGKVSVTGITAASPPVVSCTGHLYVNGDMVTLTSVSGMTEVNDGDYVVTSKTTDTISLYDTEGAAVSGTSWTAYTAGGYVYHHATNDWDYVYDLPSLCLKVLELLDENWGASTSYNWKVVKSRLYCNLEYAALKYLVRETDVSKYDTQLTEFIASRLAWLCAPKIASDDSVKQQAYQDWVLVSSQARIQNARQRQSRDAPEVAWTKRG